MKRDDATFERNADGRKYRRIYVDEYARWSKKSSHKRSYPKCDFPLMNEELPPEIVEKALALIASNSWLRLRKRFYDVSEAQWRAIKQFVLERDEYKCAYCETNAVTADHVVPFCDLGASHPDNLVAVCMRCNSSKSGTPLELWKGRKT
jgi:hypothetical protein